MSRFTLFLLVVFSQLAQIVILSRKLRSKNEAKNQHQRESTHQESSGMQRLISFNVILSEKAEKKKTDQKITNNLLTLPHKSHEIHPSNSPVIWNINIRSTSPSRIPVVVYRFTITNYLGQQPILIDTKTLV